MEEQEVKRYAEQWANKHLDGYSDSERELAINSFMDGFYTAKELKPQKENQLWRASIK